MTRRAERITQSLAGSDTGHHDHAAKGDVLQKHCGTLVVAMLRHHLGLGAKVLEMKDRRCGHKQIIPLLKTLRNRLTAGLRVLTSDTASVDAAYTIFMPRQAA